MDKLYLSDGLVNYKQQFKHFVELGILSRPNTTKSTEPIGYIDQFCCSSMYDQVDESNYASLLANNFNVINQHSIRHIFLRLNKWNFL